MSTAGGLHRAVERATRVEASALQLFVKSSRQWKSRPLPDAEIRSFRTALRNSRMQRYTLAHSSYLINLASPRAQLWERSIAAFAEELARCACLRIPYLVLHPGSHVGSGEEAGLRRVVEGLDRSMALAADAAAVTVLLETTAGQGSQLGYRFDQLGHIAERVQVAGRIGVCLDTCHVFAAGYDFRDAASYAKTFAELDACVGLERLRAFHLNDSRHELGSRRDRHEHIGRGGIGPDGFRRLLRDPRFAGLPMVLETPKGEDLSEDVENLRLLRAFGGDGGR